jgi:peptide-methionine (S)-S-oxide reductase
MQGWAALPLKYCLCRFFYYAEAYHQQYLAKNPGGYCPDITCHATGLPIFPS